jgi:hypothetical protein
LRLPRGKVCPPLGKVNTLKEFLQLPRGNQS